VAAQRKIAAPVLAAAVEARLRVLAMPRARFEIDVDGVAGDDVQFLLAANPGEPARPLAKVASGGELARTMLALRLAAARLGTDDAPAAGEARVDLDARTLVFDEVDAGIGGEAGLAVAAALADLGASHQVLVVTHLPQVAAFADGQIAVAKSEAKGRTLAEAVPVTGADRVVELSRMLSGTPGSTASRDAATELLSAGQGRRRPAGDTSRA
jgi:DNA repair protein RecN (Recombination protein N)